MPPRRDFLAFNPEKVRENVQKSDTQDLLDRATVYREGMEPEALEIIEAELKQRGVGPDQVEAHAARHRAALPGADGIPAQCSFCRRPAVARGWGFHWLWGKLPVFPRTFSYCEDHRPRSPARSASEG